MNNFAIARVFQRIADLMELRGDNVFKVRAYRNAAQTMEETTESLEVLAERGALETIPGVGEAIAAKTREILATGTCKLAEELRREVPETLTELLHLPGFGVKRIQAVWHGLGVCSLDELEAAARDGRLRTLPGFSARGETTLLETIAAARRRRERTPIGRALPYAESLLGMLRGLGAFRRVELAGSLRRMRDTVSDLDFVALADDPAGALRQAAALAELPGAEIEETPAGPVLRAKTPAGPRAELHAVHAEAGFAGAWLRATGSAAHLAALEQLRAACGVVLAGADEEAIYTALGMQYVVPELREGRGEVEAAREGRLPRLITAGEIRGVLHAHSTWSDGAAEIAVMADAARELGYSYLAITDHSRSLAVAGGLDEARLRAQGEEIAALNATYGGSFQLLRGIECDVLADGTLDLPVAALRELDFVIGSLHMHQRQERETITARALRALETGVVDLLAHPTGRILGVRDASALDLECVMERAAELDVALEINAYPDRLDLDDLQARRARERGVLLSINPDAHRTEHLGLLRYGLAQARRGWVEPGGILNTWPVERLLEWRNRRRALHAG